MNDAGVIFYDAQCGLCSATVHRLQRVLRHTGFGFSPIQSKTAQATLGSPATPPDEMILSLPDGRLLGGIAAWSHICRHVWWAFPFHLLMLVPPMRYLAEAVYRQIARNRNRISTSCGLRVLQDDRA
ncbi:MAG: DUF393 domain-containing protein [Burkholderiales bacterium]|nr:DUF393 domain-containing protein [Phycisphaerae bacterium]